MNAVYKPTATGRPATDAYAIALGRTTAAAVSPVTRSKRKVGAFGALALARIGVGDIAFTPRGLTVSRTAGPWWDLVCVSTRSRSQFPSMLLQTLGHLSAL